MISDKTKYQRWYEELICAAKRTEITTIYSEVHHILPRSCGGSDEPENLVRLDYRRHFLAHWLLTKFYRGVNLRKMQRAMIAMTMPLHGDRIIASWQFEVAKRAVKDLAMTPTQIRNRRIAKNTLRIASRDAALAAIRRDLDIGRLTMEWLAMPRPKPEPIKLADGHEPKRRNRKPRPSKRVRKRLRDARKEALVANL